MENQLPLRASPRRHKRNDQPPLFFQCFFALSALPTPADIIACMSIGSSLNHAKRPPKQRTFVKFTGFIS
jgi:hypothetical protein